MFGCCRYRIRKPYLMASCYCWKKNELVSHDTCFVCRKNYVTTIARYFDPRTVKVFILKNNEPIPTEVKE
jgi:hypothetical protein